MTPPALAIITPSFRNDYAMAATLCRSIDDHLQADHEHLLIVPDRDLDLFAPLQGPRRRVISERALLASYGLRPLPLPVRIPGLGRLRLRQQWWCRGVGRVSGWVTQQIIKLSACDLTRAEILMFIDSDVTLVRPLRLESVLREGGRLLLHRQPLPASPEEHVRWCLTARELLGIPTDAPPQWDYIGNLITWRAGNLRRLQSRIAEIQGEAWPRALARRRTLSEYMLYGIFCEELLGLEASGHRAEPSRLTYSVWTADTMPAEPGLLGPLEDEQIAIHLQSTLPIDAATRARLIQSVSPTPPSGRHLPHEYH